MYAHQNGYNINLFIDGSPPFFMRKIKCRYLYHEKDLPTMSTFLRKSRFALAYLTRIGWCRLNLMFLMHKKIAAGFVRI